MTIPWFQPVKRTSDLHRELTEESSMPHAYTEDQLVEQPAIGLFAEFGLAVAVPPPNSGIAGEPRDAGLLGRETKGEVVLVSRLRSGLERLNPALPPEARLTNT